MALYLMHVLCTEWCLVEFVKFSCNDPPPVERPAPSAVHVRCRRGGLFGRVSSPAPNTVAQVLRLGRPPPRRCKWHSMTHCHEIALAVVVRRCCHRRVEVVSRCCRHRRRCGCACVRVVLGLCAVVTLWVTFVVATVVAAVPCREAQCPTAGWLSSLSIGPLGLSLAFGRG